MKKLFVGILMVVMMVGFGGVVSAKCQDGKICCETDSYTNKTICIYQQLPIYGFDSIGLIKWSKTKYTLVLYNHPNKWELKKAERTAYFKVDNHLFEKQYKLHTEREYNKVFERVSIDLNYMDVKRISSAKGAKIRLGFMGFKKETFLNQKFKDGMKELLLK